MGGMGDEGKTNRTPQDGRVYYLVRRVLLSELGERYRDKARN